MFFSVLRFISGSFFAKIILFSFLGFFLFLPGAATTAFCEVVHVAISPETIPNANINDALATIKAWTRNAARAYGIQAKFEVNIVDSPSELRDGLDKQRFEIIKTSINNISSQDLSYDTVFVARPNGSVFVRYVLVVHRDSGITRPQELKDGTVAIPGGHFMQLADIWLKKYFQGYSHSSALSSLPKITRSENTLKAGMQVFFQQVDAAVLPKKELVRMSELNPQMKKELLIIGESEPLVPLVLIVRSSWQTPLRHTMEQILSNLHTTVLGKQILTVFHVARLEKYPKEILEPTLLFLQNREGKEIN